ncbi:MAG: hypothetical protein ACHREM_15935 [Polyangiales bacterium]
MHAWNQLGKAWGKYSAVVLGWSPATIDEPRSLIFGFLTDVSTDGNHARTSVGGEVGVDFLLLETRVGVGWSHATRDRVCVWPSVAFVWPVPIDRAIMYGKSFSLGADLRYNIAFGDSNAFMASLFFGLRG